MLTQIDLKIGVHPCDDYMYEVTTNEEQIILSYHEHGGPGRMTELFFGSYEEMEAVAKAMLKACEINKVK